MATDSTGQEFGWGRAGMACDCHITSGASTEGVSNIWAPESSGGFLTHMSGVWPGVTQRLDSVGTLDEGGASTRTSSMLGGRQTAQWGGSGGGCRGGRVQRVRLKWPGHKRSWMNVPASGSGGRTCPVLDGLKPAQARPDWRKKNRLHFCFLYKFSLVMACGIL